jgi:hypothetical protein
MYIEISEFFSDMLETQQLLYFCYVTEQKIATIM